MIIELTDSPELQPVCSTTPQHLPQPHTQLSNILDFCGLGCSTNQQIQGANIMETQDKDIIINYFTYLSNCFVHNICSSLNTLKAQSSYPGLLEFHVTQTIFYWQCI